MGRGFFLLILPFILAHPVCADSDFRRLLLTEHWQDAGQILQEEKERVIKAARKMGCAETALADKHWAGLYFGSVISTPLPELVRVSADMGFKSGETLIDIGSGHGDPGVTFGSLNPGLEILGYELVLQKVVGANRIAKKLGLSNVKFVQQDLSDENFQLPRADYYYLFNPIWPELVRKLGLQIRNLPKSRQIKVLVYGIGWTLSEFESAGFREVARVGRETHVLQYRP